MDTGTISILAYTAFLMVCFAAVGFWSSKAQRKQDANAASKHH